MIYIQPQDRNQLNMMNSLDLSIAPDNPIRIIDVLVDKIYNSQRDKFTKAKEENIGRPRYHDITFLKLYLYGYLNGISSSRKLESETKRNIEVKWLLGDLQPDHWVISNYRKENGDSIRHLTKSFRKFLRSTGYIDGKTVAIDGTKIKAYANKDMLTVKKIDKRLENLNKNIEEYLLRLQSNDTLESLEEELAIDDVGADINKILLDKYIVSQAKIEKLVEAKRFLEENNRSSVSLSDKEARLMKSRDGFIPAYNVQSGVDSKYNMIADTEVTDEENDLNQLEPMVNSIEEEIGKKPEEVLADKGYYKPTKIEEVELDEKVKCYVAIPEEKKEVSEFKYNKEKDEYICSEGKPLVLKQKNKERKNGYSDMYQGIECDGCKLRAECTKSKSGRILYRPSNIEWVERYKKRMGEIFSKAKINKRKTIVEHPFGTLKYWMGKIPLLLRGKEKVSTEINIYSTAYNIKRLLNIEPYDNIMELIIAYDWKSA
ncbi:MAG: IS1182 family transposase [Bacteroidetes bacterium]|nr:IS1182 family transposase [Bacteroidota bacterium]